MSGCEATPEVKKIIRAMAKNRVEAGVSDPIELVDHIYEEIHEHTPLWKSEIADIISGYGQERKPTRDELVLRMNAIKAELRNDAKRADGKIAEKPTPEQVKNRTRAKALEKQLADMQRRLDTGDFSKAERQKPVYDEQVHVLEARREAIRKKIDQAIRDLERQNRSPALKVTDFLLAFRRAVILSSVHTIAKLTSAATLRNVSTPIEEAIGGVLSMVPGLRGIAERAPREGGFSLAAEMQAVRKTFSRETLSEMWKTATDGMGTADALYGDHERPKYKWLDWVGQIHGALKTPAKRNEFFRSAQKIGTFERKRLIAEGKSASEVDALMARDEVQAAIGAKAYIEGQRAILMQDNFAVDGYKVMARWLQHAGEDGSVERGAGTATAKVLEYLLPIVKIPTNFVFEATSYAAGGPKAALQLAFAKGIKNLKPEQADYIMRNLKKQTVGAALLTLGYFMADAVGGYYQPGKKKKDDEPEYGGIRLFGVNIPKYLVHNSALELLQMGATIRQIETAKGQGRGTIGAGAYEAATGLLGEIPFFDQPMRLERGLRNAESASVMAGEMARDFVIPPDVQRIAKTEDPEPSLPRKPAGFTDAIKVGIPGLREQVGQGDIKHTSLDDRIAMWGEMSPAERGKNDMLKHIKDAARRHRKDMTPEQREQVRAILDSQ